MQVEIKLKNNAVRIYVTPESELEKTLCRELKKPSVRWEGGEFIIQEEITQYQGMLNQAAAAGLNTALGGLAK